MKTSQELTADLLGHLEKDFFPKGSVTVEDLSRATARVVESTTTIMISSIGALAESMAVKAGDMKRTTEFYDELITLAQDLFKENAAKVRTYGLVKENIRQDS